MILYKLIYFVPSENLEAVNQALFNAGAGTIGDYDQCCFVTMGIGQFRPRPGSNPYLGQVDKIQKVQEARVEMICPKKLLKSVVTTLKNAHPYEEPAFDIIELVSEEDL